MTEIKNQTTSPVFKAVMGTKLEKGTSLATKENIIKAIQAVQDPELLLNVYELGLIYDIQQKETGDVHILMTLTSPSCPMGGEIPFWVAGAVSSVPGVGEVEVELTFTPPWTLDKLSEEVKISMGIE